MIVLCKSKYLHELTINGDYIVRDSELHHHLEVKTCSMYMFSVSRRVLVEGSKWRGSM